MDTPVQRQPLPSPMGRLGIPVAPDRTPTSHADASRTLARGRLWLRPAVFAAAAYWLAYCAAVLARPGGDAGARTLSDFGEVPMASLAMALGIAAIRRDERRGARLAWTCMVLALAGDTIGNLVYGAYDLAGQQPFPSVADGFFLLYYPLAFAGLLLLPSASRRRELMNWRVWSNSAIVVLAGGMAVLHFVLVPALGRLADDLPAALISLAYPVGDLALVGALATIMIRRPHPADRAAIAWFIVGVAAWFLADLTFAIESSVHAYSPGSVADFVWLAGATAFVLAAQGQLIGSADGHGAAASRPLPIGQAFGFGMLALGLATLVAAALSVQSELAVLAVAAVCLTAVVLARQLADEHDRRKAEAQLIAEQAAAAEAAAGQARQDLLTGLPNRLRFNEVLAVEITASRLTGRPVTLVYTDLDLFKAINDTLGHAAGDQVLAEVGRRLACATRDGDTVARLGGDEFAMILPGTAIASALEVVARCKADLERPIALEGGTIVVTGAFGLASHPESGAADADSLMHQADVAMYRAKRDHLPPAAWSPAFDRPSPAVILLAELRAALAAEALALSFQPVCDLATRDIVAAEALVRWPHESRGTLQPGQFLPLARQAGLLPVLDSQVLSKVCRQAAEWLRLGAAIPVSVNISAQTLERGGLPELVARTLAEHRLPPSLLVLEVTEDGLLRETFDARGALAEIRSTGVRIAIDDFGTGFSSLARLRELEVDYLKIDRSFLGEAVRDPRQSGIVEAIVLLADRLDLALVAEGIEDEATVRYVRSLGVPYGQGFLFARPLSAEAFFARLTSGDALAERAQLAVRRSRRPGRATAGNAAS